MKKFVAAVALLLLATTSAFAGDPMSPPPEFPGVSCVERLGVPGVDPRTCKVPELDPNWRQKAVQKERSERDPKLMEGSRIQFRRMVDIYFSGVTLDDTHKKQLEEAIQTLFVIVPYPGGTRYMDNVELMIYRLHNPFDPGGNSISNFFIYSEICKPLSHTVDSRLGLLLSIVSVEAKSAIASRIRNFKISGPPVKVGETDYPVCTIYKPIVDDIEALGPMNLEEKGD